MVTSLEAFTKEMNGLASNHDTHDIRYIRYIVITAKNTCNSNSSNRKHLQTAAERKDSTAEPCSGTTRREGLEGRHMWAQLGEADAPNTFQD